MNTAETATGLAYNFLLMTQDAFGNRGSYAPGSFYNVTGTAMTNSVVQSGGGARRRLLQAATSSTAGSGPQFSVVNNYDGTYGITLTTTQAIPYNITIRVNGVPVKSNQPGGVTFKNLVVASGRSTKSAFTASGNGIGAATLKAGDTAQITIQARDQYGNPTVDDLTSLAASLTSSFQVRVGSSTSFTTFSDASSVTVFPPVTQNPGMIVIPFTVFKAGTLVTTLGFTDGTVLRGSPYSGTIVPGAPSAASSLASGPGLKGALACLPGAKCVPASIYLTPQDANSNPFMGAATAATARAAMCARFAVVFSVPASIIKQAPQPDANDTSRCVVTYTASAPGDQTVQVGFDSNYVVGGGQFAMTVQSGWGAADAGQSTVSGDGINSVIVAGQSYKLTVMLSDANGLTLPSSAGTNVTASANSSALVFPFVDAQNGQMTASFTPVLSGVFVVTVSVNGKVIGGYPGGFRMKVVSAATSATTSRVALLNQTLFQRVPDPFTIQIFPRDAYGNPQDYLVSGPDAFSVALTLPDQSSTTLTPTPAQCNGIKCFAASFAPSLVGNYQVKTVLNLASGNMAVGGAANIILVPVFAGVPVLAKTEFRGQGATTAPAGTPTWFQFILKDAGEPFIQHCNTFIKRLKRWSRGAQEWSSIRRFDFQILLSGTP